MPAVLEERYELGARLGSGGMAEVFAGYDRSLDRRVAIKLLKTDVPDPRARERFEQEARTAAGFVHPNAVTVYDVGDDGRRPYLVMELVEGRDLAELLAARGPLPPAEAARVADQMLAALGAAHERGLVHRDVKPGNVLVTRDGTAKLADFGIAKAAADATAGLTLTGQVMGTPRYLAPEQAAGQGATPRSDLYSAGVVLYEMLAGEPPFTGDTPVAVALAHQQAPVPPLTERRPGLPPALVAAVNRALEKDPAQRFPDAAAMRAALRGGSSATAPTVAAPPATEVMPADVAGPSRTRSRWWVAAAAVPVLFALGVALGLALVDRRDDEPTAAVDATTPTTIPPTEAPTTTAAPTTTTTPEPQTIDDLIGVLAADTGAYGEKAPDLLDKLGEVNSGEDAEKNAAKLLDEIGKWTAEGELDAGIAATAQRLLQPLARDFPGNGNGDPPGGDRGGGNDNDD
ncbi:MAG: protein kinase domain-containing protein [Acidimicrobiia bacterium]